MGYREFLKKESCRWSLDVGSGDVTGMIVVCIGAGTLGYFASNILVGDVYGCTGVTLSSYASVSVNYTVIKTVGVLVGVG